MRSPLPSAWHATRRKDWEPTSTFQSSFRDPPPGCSPPGTSYTVELAATASPGSIQVFTCESKMKTAGGDRAEGLPLAPTASSAACYIAQQQ